jgi:hypothetical protein
MLQPKNIWISAQASAPDLSGYDYASRLNTGAYHPDTIRRGFSAPDLRTGQPLLHDVLNFMTAARRAKTTYLHSPFKRVALAVTSIDGLMIKCGLMTDESSADNFGFVEGPLNVRTSKQLSVMNDDELRAYLAKHELATEMEEVMIATETWRSDYDASAIVGRVRKFNVVENSLDRVAVVAVPVSEWDRLHDMWEASENDAERSDASSDSSADLDAGESRLGRKRTRPRDQAQILRRNRVSSATHPPRDYVSRTGNSYLCIGDRK